MGLLDDAIREHLDLKRRRGGDPAEIERAEREALGPVRRNRDPTAVAESGGEFAEPVGSAFDDPDEGIATDLYEQTDEHDLAASSGRGSDEDPFAEEPDEPDADERPSLTSSQETRVMRAAEIPPDVDEPFAYEDEDEAEDRAEGQDEDVLEETPEFLQDTPDHDRLWFEQRPPRDFDFDG